MDEDSSGAVGGAPKLILRLEGLSALAMAVAIYWQTGGPWLLFALAFLAPDLSMLAYLAGPRTGALVYNLCHTTAAPAILGVFALVFISPTVGWLALIWVGHIGFDRMLGYGLKYPGAFGQTHLGRIGRPA